MSPNILVPHIRNMICFALEQKYRSCSSMAEKVQANTYRMAARGNATSFSLPCQDLLVQLQDGEVLEAMGSSVSLPRTGTELTHVVPMLLNISAQDH